MESSDTPTFGHPSSPPPNSVGSSSSSSLGSDEVRRATFPQALRGYDRDAVHDLLDRVADWMETRGSEGMRSELSRVGERTAGILTAAEETASKLRDEAIEYAENLRADAEEESRTARLNASQRMDEMIAEAEEKAQRVMAEAVARREQLTGAITSLVQRRDEIAADAARLGDELLEAVDRLRASDTYSEPVAHESDELAAEDATPSGLYAADDPEATQVHEFSEAEVDDEDPTVLVDRDVEDDTPPRGFFR